VDLLLDEIEKRFAILTQGVLQHDVICKRNIVVCWPVVAGLVE
jgi:hypothetical protein